MVPRKQIKKIRSEQQRIKDLVKNQQERISKMMLDPKYIPSKDEKYFVEGIEYAIMQIVGWCEDCDRYSNVLSKKGGEE